MAKQARKYFIYTNLSADKFDRKNGISKICLMTYRLFKSLFYRSVGMIVVLLLFSSQAQTQEISSTDSFVYFSQLPNGINFLLAPREKDNKVEISYYIKVGTVYENDTISGISHILQSILADKIASYLRNDQNPVSFNNTALKTFVTPELSVFQLSTPPSKFSDCLRLLRDSLNYATVSDKEITNKAEQVKKEYAEIGRSFRDEYMLKLKQHIYRYEADRQIQTGDTSDYVNINEKNMGSFYHKYYGPNNSIVNVIGKFNLYALQDTLTKVFNRVPRLEFDPESITKIFDFKTMVYTSRFSITAPEGVEPEIKISWMFPGARTNAASSHCGYLLTTLLNDENNYIQVKARKMGCKMMRAEYDGYNFSGIFTVTLKPGKENFLQVYEFVRGELFKMDKMLINESMMAAAKVNFKNWFEKFHLTSAYPSQITRFWVYNYEKYLPTLSDSVMNISEKRMHKFINEYINESARTTAVIASESDYVAMKLDSAMVAFNDSILNLSFTYPQNVTDLEGEENLNKLNILVQWLRENPDINVQVNGMADTKEINMMKDRSVLAFIDTIPTFERVKGDFLIRSMMRTEMLRALKVVRQLYLHGIELNRLKGTSMAFRSKTKEEEDENRRCTLSFEKQKVNYTLREQFYESAK
ncbi:MAG: insulinase family protein [Bacteroidetes bacterium]|nr:insulinase family protein [Bacteroidota bacterium]